MVSITTWIGTTLLAFVVGILAGRYRGAEVCRGKIRTLLENKVITYEDENNGDC